MRAYELTEQNLSEGASSIIYHYTSVSSAVKILSEQRFELSSTLGSVEEQYAPKGYPFFLSTTRTLMGGYHNMVGDSGVMFNLDGNYYNQRYKAAPVDYWGDRHNEYGRISEAEDRIFSKTPYMTINGITEVHLYVKPMSEKDRKNWGEYIPSYARKLVILAKQLSIPVFLYEDKVSWKFQKTKNAVPISKRETLTGKAPTGRYRSPTRRQNEFTRWLELIYKNDYDALSTDSYYGASRMAYDLVYTSWADHGGSLKNELSNSRKPGSMYRDDALKLIKSMQQNGWNSIPELVEAMKEKWSAIMKQRNDK